MTRQKAKERRTRKIVEAASRRLRRDGVEGVAVADVMSDAGATHGAFYAHFASKAALIEAALRDAMESRRQLLAPSPHGRNRFEAALRWYLHPDHRDHPARGCPLPRLAGELEASPDALRTVFEEELEVTVREVAEQLFGNHDHRARERAIGFLALCAGAIALSRAAPSARMSDEILFAARGFARAAAGEQAMGKVK